ncbi:molybdopterin-binding oxidoreductase, partial [Streptomyces mirabilis]
MRDEEKDQRVRPGWSRLTLGALSGALAGFAALAVAELVAAGLRPQSSPVIAVGGASIDATPPPVKDWALPNYRTDDNHVLE